MRPGLLIAAGLFALFLGWNAPNHYPPWPAFHLEAFAGLGLALLAIGVVTAPRPATPPGGGQGAAVVMALPLASWAWIAAGAWPALQWAGGQLAFGGDAAIGLLYGLGAGLGLYVGALAAARHGRERVLQALWLTLLAAALAAAGLALAQWLRLTVTGGWAMELIDDRPFANFGQPNHLGLAMVWGLIAAAALHELGVLRHRAVVGTAVTLLAVGLAASGSRAAGLALGAVALLWLLTRRRVPSRLRLADVALALAVLAAIAGLAPMARHALRLDDAPSPGREILEVGPRQVIWQHFAAAIGERPWLGHGFNQSVAALAEVAERVEPSRNTVYAHQVVLDLATWFGLPMALLLTGALGWWVARGLRRVPSAVLMSQRHPVAAVWVALAVQSSLEFPYAHAYFLLPAVLLAGAVAPSAGQGLRSSASPRPDAAAGAPTAVVVASAGARALTLGAVALFGVFVVDYLRMESDFRTLRFERARFHTTEAPPPLRTPWLLDQLGALNAAAREPPRPGLSPAALQRSRTLARRFHIPSVRLDHAKALALNGRGAEAERELRVIRSVNAPAHFASIDAQWQGWLREHAAEIDDASRR